MTDVAPEPPPPTGETGNAKSQPMGGNKGENKDKGLANKGDPKEGPGCKKKA